MASVSWRMSSLFAPGADKVLTIPPAANFLRELAAALSGAEQARDDPGWLSEAIIYVPNQRSVRNLAQAFLNVASGRAMLLPNIRALGDLETDEPPPSAEAALADLPPVISAAQRIGQLTRLVLAYYSAQGTDLPASGALSAAQELARLLDQAALSGEADLSRLNEIPVDRDLAAHWERSASFLSIITQQWPARLDDAQAMDPYARRFAAAEALADHWRRAPPQAPVIIAGSTGATPASRVLMDVARQLPNGLVLLPGLDQDASGAMWERVLSTPSHPQFAMAQALRTLGLTRGDVGDWRATSIKTRLAGVAPVDPAIITGACGGARR
ncbi:MAG: double-strand break repair protein AddB, partial [Pseudomonadota bacterium]